jgi:1-acyl-sn-glycerol-3-phosphate acyltransferase
LAANIWAWSGLAVLSALALLLAGPWLGWGRLRGRSVPAVIRDGVWLYGRACLHLWRPVVKVNLAGRRAARLKGPALMAINHQSWLDLYLMSAQNARNVCFLVRAWPFRRLFFFRPLMRLAGYIETEGAPLEDLLASLRAEAGRGAILAAFPEGGRSPDGELGRFHSGLFKLAMDMNLPVWPLVIHHSGRVMPKGFFLFRPGSIRVEFGPPLRPEDFAQALVPHGAMRRAARLFFQRTLAAHDRINRPARPNGSTEP